MLSRQDTEFKTLVWQKKKKKPSNWEQLKYPSIGEQINWHIHTRKYYSSIRTIADTCNNMDTSLMPVPKESRQTQKSVTLYKSTESTKTTKL